MGRQKFFQLTKQGLIDAYNDSFNQSAHMKALICQLPYIPKFVLAGEISSLVPLLLSALKSRKETENDELVLATLSSLQDLMLQDPKSFANILPNFLNVWLQLGCGGEKNKISQANMSIRIKALNCVEN